MAFGASGGSSTPGAGVGAGVGDGGVGDVDGGLGDGGVGVAYDPGVGDGSFESLLPQAATIAE